MDRMYQEICSWKNLCIAHREAWRSKCSRNNIQPALPSNFKLLAGLLSDTTTLIWRFMVKPDETDREAQLTQLKELYRKGLLSKENFQAAITGLGMDPVKVFNQLQQKIEHQTNVRKMSGGIAQPDAIFRGDVHQAGRDIHQIIINGRTTETTAEKLANNKIVFIDEDNALVLYLRYLIESNRRLQLKGIRSAGQLVNIDLEQVYVTLTTTGHRAVAEEQCWLDKAAKPAPGEAKRMVSMAQDFSRETVRDEKISVQKALAAHPRLVVLGDPGSGKTTLLKYLALTYARSYAGESDLVKERLDLEESLLPILLPLRNFARHLDSNPTDTTLDGPVLLLDYLRKFFTSQDVTLPERFFADRLQRGNCAVLLDGVDEVADTDMRQRISRMIDRFTISYPDNRYVVTSRIRGYTENARLNEGYCVSRVRDFNRADIKLFLIYWNRAVETTLIREESDFTRQEAEERTNILLDAIDNSERVRELAVNPLLLTVIALVQRYRAQLPQRRTELYEEAIEVLLGKWDEAKGLATKTAMTGRKLDAGDQRSMLEPIALWMMEHRAREIEMVELRRQLGQQFAKMTSDLEQADSAAEDILRLINERSGLLTERGQGIYSFSHLTFQEHLAARAVADRKDYISYTLNRLDDSWWREVVLLQAGYLSTQGKQRVTGLIESIMDCKHEPEPYHNLVLAAECLRDVGQARVEGGLWQEVEQRLRAEFEPPLGKAGIMKKVWSAIGRRPNQSYVVRRRAAAAEALARIENGGSGTQPAFWRLPYGEPLWVNVLAGEFWMGSDRGLAEESPVHRVFLESFLIAKVPVTNAQYRLFVDAAGHNAPRHWEDGRVTPGLKGHPVVNVSWHDALAYCRWLAEVTGKPVTLPSEAQWEKAARGSDDQRDYPWGGAWNDSYCNTRELGLAGSIPVGIFPEGVSPYGCLDMIGNVREWTSSLWKKGWDKTVYRYPYDPADGRENLEADDNALRVLRGGSWYGIQGHARCSYRFRYDPLDWFDLCGFRVVVSPIV